jgi:hypothetical protein
MVRYKKGKSLEYLGKELEIKKGKNRHMLPISFRKKLSGELLNKPISYRGGKFYNNHGHHIPVKSTYLKNKYLEMLNDRIPQDEA